MFIWMETFTKFILFREFLEQIYHNIIPYPIRNNQPHQAKHFDK